MLFRCNKIVDMNSSVDAMKDSWITFLMFGLFYVIWINIRYNVMSAAGIWYVDIIFE